MVMVMQPALGATRQQPLRQAKGKGRRGWAPAQRHRHHPKQATLNAGAAKCASRRHSPPEARHARPTRMCADAWPYAQRVLERARPPWIKQSVQVMLPPLLRQDGHSTGGRGHAPGPASAGATREHRTTTTQPRAAGRAAGGDTPHHSAVAACCCCCCCSCGRGCSADVCTADELRTSPLAGRQSPPALVQALTMGAVSSSSALLLGEGAMGRSRGALRLDLRSVLRMGRGRGTRAVCCQVQICGDRER